MSVIAHLRQRPRCIGDDTSAGDNDAASTRSRRPQQETSSDGNGTARSHPTNLSTSASWFKIDTQTNRIFQNEERDKWTSSRCDQSRGDSTVWNTVDDQTVETPRTLHVLRAMRGILRYPVSGISDVNPHVTTGGHPACIETTGETRNEEQEEQCCESSGGSMSARQSLTERQPGNPVE